MSYHGDPSDADAVQHMQKVYTIFWNPPGTSFPSGYQTNVNQFIQDLSGSSYYAIASQYGDSAGNVSPTLSYGGTWLDTANAIPSPLGNQDLLQEINRAKAANGWTSDSNSYFQLYTPSNVTGSGFCGYHTFDSSTNLAFGLVLLPVSGCFLPSPWPNGSVLDAAISVSAHEIMETVTDPLFDGWFYQDGSGEIGDLCAYIVGQRDNLGANLTLNGRHYLIQEEWSNANSGCVVSYGSPDGSCGNTGASTISKPFSVPTNAPPGGVLTRRLRPGGETWTYTFEVKKQPRDPITGFQADQSGSGGTVVDRSASVPAPPGPADASGTALAIPNEDLRLISPGSTFLRNRFAVDADLERVHGFDQTVVAGAPAETSGISAEAGYSVAISQLGSTVQMGNSALALLDAEFPDPGSGQTVSSIRVSFKLDHPHIDQLRLWLTASDRQFLLWDGRQGGVRTGSSLIVDRVLSGDLLAEPLASPLTLYIYDTDQSGGGVLTSALIAITMAPRPATALSGQVGESVTLDIAALRAYFKTAPGGGSEVDTPGVGQTVYLHGDSQITGTGSSVTVNQRALLDGFVFCSFSATGSPGFGYTSWCNSGWTATAGTHTLEWDFDYTNSVPETNESNNSTFKTFTSSGLDIVASRAYFKTAPGSGSEVDPPTVGQTVYLHGDSQVTGTGGSVTVNQRALLDGSVFCSFGATDSPGFAYMSWCNSGWTATAGTHTLEWDYDYTNSIPEINESNNSAFKTFTSSGLDIAAVRAYLRTAPSGGGTEVDPPALGQTVYLHGDSQITGTGGSVTVNQRALLDGSVFCSFSATDSPGFSYISWCNGGWSATAGTHTLEWDYDYTNSIPETNESNNSAFKTFTPSGLDIAAVRAYLRTAPSGGGAEVDPPTVGQTVYLHGDSQVTGTGGDVTVNQRALLDGSVFCSFGATDSPGFSYTSWCNSGWTATAGTHTLEWDFDYTNSIPEANENNNSVSKSFTPTGGIDIAAQRAYLRTASSGGGSEVGQPSVGQTVYLHGDYQVTGSGNAVNVTERALLDGSVFCACSNNATPGSSYTSWCNHAWTATSGSHTLQWDFDYNNSVPETNENNNSTSTSFSVAGDTIPPTTSITAPANNATLSGTTSVTATASDNVGVTSLEIDIDGSAKASNANLSSLTYSWNTTTASNGQHTIVSKAGDAAGHLTTSSTVTVTVSNGGLAAPGNVIATAVSPSQVNLTWNQVNGAASYQIFRNSNNLGYVFAGTSNSNGFTNGGLSANTTYLYEVRAVDSSNNLGPLSNADLATTVMFTDDPLIAGSTTIKAVHISELRTAVNAMRTAAGLSPSTFTDSIVSGVLVRAIHIAELRSSLDEARSHLGLLALSYSDPTLTNGNTPIRAAHITELRFGVK